MNIQHDRIIIKGADKTNQVVTYAIKGTKVDVTFTSGQTYTYSRSNVKIFQSALSESKSRSCFEYFREIAECVGLIDNDGNNILANRYKNIGFVGKDSMLTPFLCGQLDFSVTGFEGYNEIIYPFGFNLSQKKAVENALNKQLSIIEGPPGTGKTQTILNIIANIIYQGGSVAVVSGNNSATANIYEKLQKYELNFIAAMLGNTDNKNEFIGNQKPIPDLSSQKIYNNERTKIIARHNELLGSLTEMLKTRNELAKLKLELDNISTEYQHFLQYLKPESLLEMPIAKEIKRSSVALDLWLLAENFAENSRKMPNMWIRIIQYFKYGITREKFYNLPSDSLIMSLQKCYYELKISELDNDIYDTNQKLIDKSFNDKMHEYSDLSLRLFRNSLAKKYGKLYKNGVRPRFEIDNLWKSSERFIEGYPVILSTTYSLRSSLGKNVMYDYVIVDESSQVDLATGALALSCAKNAVIVGDLKQLPNVVDSKSGLETDEVFATYDLPEVYRYKNHSLLSTVSELFPSAPKVLLREHYRCHPKIIGFCNQKFYNGELIILTEPKNARKPLVIYETVEGNHARDHINRRQIDVIINEVIPQQNINQHHDSVGIVTPYRNQTNVLQKTFAHTGIKADTVDKFQGRENDIIILSTVDNEVTKFSDNANRLNVAISRAIDQLIVVVSNSDIQRDTNVGDLVKYIRYNNFEVIKSQVRSVFDYLYKDYAKKRREFLLRHRRISEYDSENLMFTVIEDVLAQDKFSKFSVATQVPIKAIICNFDKLNDYELKYASNILTRVDFLIFNKIDKSPRLVVEVDGVSFHKPGSRQSERDEMKNTILEKYGLRFIRFRTDETRERERLESVLSDIL